MIFHSISFPNEWGRKSLGRNPENQGVSIQLVSPASGDLKSHSDRSMLVKKTSRFHSISFPSEWGRQKWVQTFAKIMFPFN
jgi:hypothetical protein